MSSRNAEIQQIHLFILLDTKNGANIWFTSVFRPAFTTRNPALLNGSLSVLFKTWPIKYSWKWNLCFFFFMFNEVFICIPWGRMQVQTQVRWVTFDSRACILVTLCCVERLTSVLSPHPRASAVVAVGKWGLDFLQGDHCLHNDNTRVNGVIPLLLDCVGRSSHSAEYWPIFLIPQFCIYKPCSTGDGKCRIS